MSAIDEERRKILQSLCYRTLEDVESDLDALSSGPTAMDAFLKFAVNLRDEGAVCVSCGVMSVTFAPRHATVTVDAVAAAIAKEETKPASDEDYIP